MRFAAARDWRVGKRGVTANRDEVSFVGDENVLQLVVMPVQLCEYARNHWIAHFKSIKIMYVNYSSIKLLKKKFAIDKGLKLIYLNWRTITLQYCGGFCHTPA